MQQRPNHVPYIIRGASDFAPAFCPKCETTKPLSDYYRHSTRSDGAIRYRPLCKQCRVVGGRKNKARPVHSALIATGKQVCRYCKTELPLDKFYANGCFSDGTPKYRSRCKDCVLQKAADDQPKVYKNKAKKRSASPKNFLAGILLRASKRKQHLGFDLDLQYILARYTGQQGKCALSGEVMTYIAGEGRVATNISIDRIDSSVGYVRGNVQLVCDVVNRMKSDMSATELQSWCGKILRSC